MIFHTSHAIIGLYNNSKENEVYEKYSIGQFAKEIKVTVQTLRDWGKTNRLIKKVKGNDIIKEGTN